MMITREQLQMLGLEAKLRHDSDLLDLCRRGSAALARIVDHPEDDKAYVLLEECRIALAQSAARSLVEELAKG